MSADQERGGSEDEVSREPVRAAANLGEDDFYMDGPYLVFTAAYHRKRGYCCGSGCRHCPYGSATPDCEAKI